MRYRVVARISGLLVILLSIATLAFLLVAVYEHLNGVPGEAEAVAAFLGALLLGALAGALLMLLGRRIEGQVRTRESLLIVALAWVLGAAVAALPFWLWAIRHPAHLPVDPAFRSYLNCYFEAMSGLTTTGSSVLTDIESVPRSILLWRGFIQWLGGLGIVLLFVAVLPLLGASGARLFLWEKTGIVEEGGRHQIRAIARVLWLVYAGITAAEALLLAAAGMSWLDALEHAFATMPTGGYSTKNASIGQFASPAIDWIVIVFMILGGANFGFYYRALSGQGRSVLRDPELRGYLAFCFAGSLLLVLLIGSSSILTSDGRTDVGAGALVRHGIFQTLAFFTSTGFATADSDQWPMAAKMLLLALMFVGACPGSTGGGLKVTRVLLLLKILVHQIAQVAQPRVVRPVRWGRHNLSVEDRQEVLVFVLLFLLVYLVGAVLIYAFEADRGADLVTAASAAAATLNNVGPGFHLVGATANFGWMTPASKLVMCALMPLGRLELYALLALLMPGFWRR